MMIPNDVLGEAYELADDDYIAKISRVRRIDPFGHTWGEDYVLAKCEPVDVEGPLDWQRLERCEGQYGNCYLITHKNENTVLIKRNYSS